MLNALQDHCEVHQNINWMNLARFTALLIILHSSLIFLTELVTRPGHYDTYFPLLALPAVEFALLVPLGLVGKLWYDGIALVAAGLALYFLIASGWFWVDMSNV